MMLLRTAVPLDCCGGAFGSGFIHILMAKFQLPSRSVRSLWFSLSFDISIICFIISCGFGGPPGALTAPAGDVATAGDVAEVCANKGLAIAIANRMAANDVNFFMVCIVPVTSGQWQVRSDLFGNKFETSVCSNAPGYRREQNRLAKRALSLKRVSASRAPKRPCHYELCARWLERLARETQWRKILK